MIICKFCGKPQRQELMSLTHRGMCKACYNDLMKYRRVIIKQEKSFDDDDLIAKIERICRSNKDSGRYVPSFYLGKNLTKIVDKCGYCGATQAAPRPGYKDMCVDCGKIEHNYRSHLARFKDLTSPNNTMNAVRQDKALDKCLIKLHALREYYNLQASAGFKVPSITRERL